MVIVETDEVDDFHPPAISFAPSQSPLTDKVERDTECASNSRVPSNFYGSASANAHEMPPPTPLSEPDNSQPLPGVLTNRSLVTAAGYGRLQAGAAGLVRRPTAKTQNNHRGQAGNDRSHAGKRIRSNNMAGIEGGRGSTFTEAELERFLEVLQDHLYVCADE
eukprot:gb/GEZJ01004863.1/.p1 GENE.gb/GEZJ01004863.1/~~gb/GEZJ01004863.1/.p1  ORF type:complete len:163 (-),score=17.77 gb/GEZJ01004863.1/:833-1321(-)